MEGGVNQPDFITIDYFDQLILGPQKQFSVGVFDEVLELNLHPIVILEKFNLTVRQVRVLLDLLEQMLAVQPNHLHRAQLNTHLPEFLIGHPDLYFI